MSRTNANRYASQNELKEFSTYTSQNPAFIGGRRRGVGQILEFPTGRDRLYATLSRGERDFVESLLHLTPNYSYDLSGLPKLNPPPAPGVASAAAADKMIVALIREGSFDIAQIAFKVHEVAPRKRVIMRVKTRVHAARRGAKEDLAHLADHCGQLRAVLMVLAFLLNSLLKSAYERAPLPISGRANPI